MWSTLVLALVIGIGGTLEVKIGVVEQSLELAEQLAAAVDAALQGAGLEDAEPAHVEPVEPGEVGALPGHVCAQAAGGAAAVVGGGEGGAAALSAAGAARAGLPLLLVQPTPHARGAWEALALYPHDEVLAEVCVDLCREKDWKRAVLLHERGLGARAAALLAPGGSPLDLVARALPPSGDDALLRNLLLVLKKAGATNFIVWCDAPCAVRVLDAAQRAGLLAERHAYIVLSPELHTQALHDYSHGGANITGVMLFDPESESVVAAMVAWREAYAARLGDALDEEVARLEEVGRLQAAPPSSLLLAYDAATLVAGALSYLGLPELTLGDCERGAGAFHADTLLNYLRSEEWSGVSGALSWAADGARRAVRLQVAELARGGQLRSVGMWAPRAGITWHREPLPERPLPPDSMTNRTFNILIAKNDPYIMARESTTRLSGNDRYEGFCIELIERLSELLNFNYTFILQEDGAYGTYNATTGQWNGMLRRLMDDPNIDFAITDLTITAEREKAVDFTTPFMNLGISILFRKPKPPEPELFAFLLPFSKGVWLCLGFAYLGTSLILYVVGRLCPEEWQNPYPCIEDPPALENQFTLANALWFNLGAVLLQGSEIAPVAYGTRAVASAWWLFALVITSSYTANLATLLAKKSSTELIQNVKELADNDLGISYGAKDGGATYTFFEHSQQQSELFQKMYMHMKEQQMPTSNEEGIQKVVNSSYNYAFLMESTTIEYTVERNCAVNKVGDLLDSKGYGIAMKKNSQYRQALNLALLKMQESGVLREMKHTWWKEKHGGGACKPVDDFESVRLSMDNFLGLFLVLVVGCAIGVLVSCCDLAWSAWRHPRDPAAPFSRRFWDELRFVFRFEQSVKPLEGSLSESTSGSARSETSHDGTDVGVEGSGSPEESRSGSGRSRAAPAADAAAAAPAPPPAHAPVRARRRSSMHAASVRLARHAHESGTPAPSGR